MQKLLQRFISFVFLVATSSSGREVTFEGKKLTPIVDLSEGGFVGAQGTYTHLKRAQLRDFDTIFTACDQDDVAQTGLFSADIGGITPLLEVGAGALADAGMLELGEFRDLGPETPLPLIIQPAGQADRIWLSLFRDGVLHPVIDANTRFPNTESDYFSSIERVVAVGNKVAFVGTSQRSVKGIFLYVEGTLHDLDPHDPDPFTLRRFGDDLAFDGERVFYFAYDNHDRFPGSLHEASIDSPPTLLAPGEGEIDDQGVLRKYRLKRDIVSLGDELLFVVDLETKNSSFGTALMKHDGTGLQVVARSRNFLPWDQFTLRVIFASQPFSDGADFYLGGPNGLFRGFDDFGSSSLLQRRQGLRTVRPVDLERGIPLVIEHGDLPQRLWTDPNVPGPVEFPVPMASQSVSPGETAVFEVNPEGLGPFTYQWRLNDGDFIEGATTNRLEVSEVSWEDTGTVTVLVSNSIDSNETSADLDIEAPPELLVIPSSRRIVAGEGIDIFLRARGKRPLTYEFLSKPEGSSLEMFSMRFPFDASQAFPFYRITSPEFTEADSGIYQIRISNSLGFSDISLNLIAAEVPPNSRFGGKDFSLFWDTSDPEIREIASSHFTEKRWIWDGDNERFLNPNRDEAGINDPFVAFDANGSMSPILPINFDEENLSSPRLVGYLSQYGTVFHTESSSPDTPTIYGEKEGVLSVLISSQQIENEFQLEPDGSDLDLKAYRGSIVGLVESSGFPVKREWGILHYADGIARLLVTSDDEPEVDIDEDYLGCDEQFRPLFYNGNDFEPGGPPFVELGPRIKRIESDGSRTILRLQDFPTDLRGRNFEPVAIPSDGGTKFLGWGGHLIEVLEDRLELQRITHDKRGQTIFGADFASQSFATKYRVFFVARSYPGRLSSSDLELLNLEGGFPSLPEKIFSWTSGGIEEVFSGSYFDGVSFPPGTKGGAEGRILGAVGDQVLVEHSLDRDVFRSEILINKGRGEVLPPPLLGKAREGLYLDSPIGAQLEKSDSLDENWEVVPTSGESILITPLERKLFFRVR